MTQEQPNATPEFRQTNLDEVLKEIQDQNAKSSRFLKINAGDLVSVNFTGNVFDHVADFAGTKKKMLDFELAEEIDTPTGKIHRMLSFSSEGQFSTIKTLVEYIKAGRKSIKIGRSGTGKDTRYQVFAEK